ncbi:hypothetical protein IW261DRAFT_1569751 [Armillaria novae-zelandiae]|uniref:Uncharacterized protein n=1 Tax=Armillaria novae-zelandiae TaxID=153914 RepID=A0AA39TY79_9AGAR|nr:hypothetical protein IW261DRAFT_1569751 [Armillaria novae-zelandiae]
MQSMVTDLLEKEKEALISDKPIAGMSIGVTELIMEGVCLDHEQVRLTLLEKRESDPKYRTEAEEQCIQATRTNLSNDTVEWLHLLAQFFPSTCASIPSVDVEHPEKCRLPLPSCLPKSTCIRYGMEALFDIEYSLHVGQAHDILAEIRELIIAQSYNTCILDKLDAMHRYNLVRRCLITLGLSPLDSDLHELTVAHMTAKNAAQSRGIGDSMRPNAWLWGALKPEGLDASAEEEWIMEVKRVKWMHDHADLDRWTEEVELLEEERQRVEVSHRRTADAWVQMAKCSDIQTGAAAYAYKVSDVYVKLANDCIERWNKALKKIEGNREQEKREEEELE